MKKLIILIAVLFTVSAQAKIEIKHWQVGSEWTKKSDGYGLTHDTSIESRRLKLTLAGARVDSLYVSANVDKTKSMFLYFTMHSDHFEAVKDAVSTKYSLTCEKSTVTNAMGAKFINEYCSYTEDGDMLVLEKYDGKISEMSLQIYNIKELDEWNKKNQAETKSDI
jgi:hypothetical protein